ncbi:hypothetical protein MVEN_00830800 [Mycena venus]|uniref:Uncharacterized protein n=1 Tax=Mycena venus TaxID=2733690 RepID=A0A8H6YGG4_9AGAR|nr:hypothetical protein MVEN_00830800 [Mycena venus]
MLRLLDKWARRKEPVVSLHSPHSPYEVDVLPRSESSGTAESVLNALTIALSLAEQIKNALEVAPFVGHAAKLMSKIQKAYKELKNTDGKRNILAAHLLNLTHDICATALRMEAAKHSDLISRLRVDLEKYAALVTKASRFIKQYGNQGRIANFAGRGQLAEFP